VRKHSGMSGYVTCVRWDEMTGITGKRPNVVLFICDQMQYQRQGTVDPFSFTPHLDRFAAEGVFFSQHHSSNAQCVPSRASLQTGLYPHEAEVMIIYRFHGHSAHITGSHYTIGHAFRDRGYQTAYFGKTHFGVPLDELGYVVGDEGPPPVTKKGGHFDLMSEVDAEIMRSALAFIESYDAPEPLFLTVSLHLPHPPFEMIGKFADRFDPAALPLPENSGDPLHGKPVFQQDHANDPQHGQNSEPALRREMHQYYSMISQVDEHFGQVRAALERRDMWHDSIVAFTSDHGDMMGAHRMRLKGTLPYDELFRVPLILKLHRHSSTPLRQCVDDLSVNVSLGGTLLEAATGSIPPRFRGNSLLGSLYREQRPAQEAIFFEHYGAYWGLHPFMAVKVRGDPLGHWKYAKYFGPDEGEAELYDLDHDPHELHNRANDDACRDVRKQLDTLVEDWWQRTGGRDFAYYESPEFKERGLATLVDGGHS